MEKAGEKYEYCVGDPSMWNKIILGENTKNDEGESIAEIMMNQGLIMRPGDNDRENGLARYREALAIGADRKPRYRVFSNCYDTIRTIPALVYDKTRVEDVDTDGEDHCYDRDRYYFMSRPVQSIKKDEKPKTKIQKHFAKAKERFENELEPEWRDWETV